MSVDRQVLQVDALRLVGEDTELDLAGTVDVPKQALALTANGAANLAVLQGFAPDVRSSGRAEVAARVTGTVEAPVVSGTALLSDGRLRHFGVPHALEALNGIVTFTATGVQLDGLSARLAGGPVRFAGRVGLNGYTLSEYDVIGHRHRHAAPVPRRHALGRGREPRAARAQHGAGTERARHGEERHLDPAVRHLGRPVQFLRRRQCDSGHRRRPVGSRAQSVEL